MCKFTTSLKNFTTHSATHTRTHTQMHYHHMLSKRGNHSDTFQPRLSFLLQDTLNQEYNQGAMTLHRKLWLWPTIKAKRQKVSLVKILLKEEKRKQVAQQLLQVNYAQINNYFVLLAIY